MRAQGTPEDYEPCGFRPESDDRLRFRSTPLQMSRIQSAHAALWSGRRDSTTAPPALARALAVRHDLHPAPTTVSPDGPPSRASLRQVLEKVSAKSFQKRVEKSWAHKKPAEVTNPATRSAPARHNLANYIRHVRHKR